MFAWAKPANWRWNLQLIAIGLMCGLAAEVVSVRAQDPPPENQEEKKEADAQKPAEPSGDEPAPKPAGPIRTGRQGNVGKSRVNRQPGTPGAQPANPAVQPANPDGQPNPNPNPPTEEMNPDVQRKIDELLRNRARGEEPDPELQKQIDELLRSQGVTTQPAQNQPGAVQPNTQLQPPQPADPAAKPDPRELARQRAEERRKKLQQQQQQNQPSADPNAQPSLAGDQPGSQPPPLPPPQVFQQPAPEQPSGPTQTINIPAAENPVPPEERTYGFSIKNGTYEQLIEGFARQTGMGVIGDVPQGGTLNFITTEQLSFAEALSRVRMLLFNYKPHEPYWLLRNKENLQVIRVTDLYRIMPPDRVYQTMEAYKAANLQPEEIALVFFTPTQGSVNDLIIARDFLPDYVRLTSVADQNRIAIFALVKDIERYLEFINIVAGSGEDARVIERIECKTVTPTDAVSKLSQMMPLEGGARAPVTRGGARAGQAGAELVNIPEPAVNVIPDDMQGVIIVRAMPAKITEIKRLMTFIDVEHAGEAPAPVVVQLKHARADEVIPVLQQMLTSSSVTPDAAGGGARPPRRSRRPTSTPGAATPAAPGPSSASTDAVAIIGHPSNTSIILLSADPLAIEETRELIELVDVPNVTEWTELTVANADAETLKETLLSLLAESGKPESVATQMFVDPSGRSLWFSGSPRELEQVRALIAKLDVAGDLMKYFRYKLEFQDPTFVANMLREFDGSGAAAGMPSPTPSPAPAQPGEKPRTRLGRGMGARRGGAVNASKFTADEASRTLWVLCTEKEWPHYLDVIKQIDVPADDAPPFVRVAVQHTSSEKAVERLSAMIGGTSPDMSSDIRLLPAGDSILVVGASPRELERLKIFLAEVDKPSAVEQRIFEIKFGDAAEIKTAIETLVMGEESAAAGAGSASRRFRPKPVEGAAPGPAPMGGATAGEPVVSDELTIFQTGNRLLVRAVPEKLDEIEALIAVLDIRDGATQIKVYDKFPTGADIEGMADTITSVMSGGPQPRASIRPREGAGPAASSGPRLIPQPAAGRLIVIADPADFPKIEELLEVLRFESPKEKFVVDFINVKHANPDEVVEAIEPVLAIKIRGLVTSGELTEPAAAAAGPGEGPAAIQRLTQRARGKDSGDRYHIAPDSRNKRIVVAAPQVIIEEVRQLVAQFDIAGEAGEIVFRTIELTNATPTEMIRAIKEMFGKPSPQRVAAVKRPVQSGQIMPNAGGGEAATGESLTIVEAPGGNSIILHGVKADVEQAITWIKELDALSNLGRVVKVYKIQNADLSVVFDLLVSLVDTTARVANAPAAAPRAMRAPLGKDAAEEDSDEPEFETKKTYTSADMYLHADLLGGTILVATTPGKVQQIEHLLKSFEEDETIASALDKAPAIPKFTYRLKFANPTDAAWDLKDALKLYWDPPNQLPQVESSSLFDELVVRYPDESRFDEIRKMIRDYADQPDKELLERTNKVFLAPEGYPADYVARILSGSLKGVDVEVVDKTPDAKDWGIEVVAPSPKGRSGGHPCILPASLIRAAAATTGVAMAQTPEGQERPADEPEPQPQPVDEDEPADLQDEMIRQAAPPPTIRVETAPAPTESERPKDEAEKGEADDDMYAGEKVRIIFNKETGEIRYEGPFGKIEQIEDVLRDLKDEELPAPPDIRIVRPQFIDVYLAKEIIEEMFNATRQQRQEAMQFAQQQARMAQQMAQQAARAQQGGQRGQQPGQRGGRGEEEDPRQQNVQQQQPVVQGPQLPPTTVRVYPNRRDRTLILRADSSQYPQIMELLATIDKPKPFDSLMRTFPLKKLNAKEVEELLRHHLNLDGGGERRSARSRAASIPGMEDGGGPVTSGGGDESLPQTVLQETVGGTNFLGVDPEDIKLFASETSNSIMVTAPLAALELIEGIIKQLESGDLPQRLTKYYKLLHAGAEDVVGYLSAHFATDSGGAKPKAAGEGAGTTVAGGGAPNAPAFIAYSQLNQITVQATEPQIAEIDDIIARLDVSSGTTSWRDVPVLYVDAAQAATTLNEMYGNKSGSGAPGKTSGVVPRFIGTEGSGIVLFSAPENLHNEILETIAKLEEKYKAPSTIRVLQLKFADPTTVAEAIQKAYEPRSGTKGAAPSAKFTITPHNSSRQLFVKAPDELFAEISSLVTSLDKAGDMPEFRIYKLKHANAKSIHAMLTKLVGEYLQRLGQNKGGFGSEAFSVQPEESANALIVLGGPVVFGFVEENLRQIDQPDATSGPMVSVTIPLTNVDASELASTLTASWSQRGMAPELLPQIHANRQANSLIIRANQGQIDEMRKTVIEPLEQQGVKMTGEVRIVQLKYGDASEIKAALEEYLRKSGGGGRPGELVGDVRLSPMVQSNSLMLAGAKEEVDRLVGIIETMDLAGELGNVPQIIPLKHVNASLLVTMIEELFAGQGGNRRGSTPPVIAADPTGKFLVVRADASDMGSIEKMVEKLDTEDQAGKDPYKIVSVKAGINVEILAEQVETSVNESARRRTMGKGTDVPAIMATPDSRTNTITIAGSPALFADAEGMIKTLEGMGPAGAPSTRVIGGMRLGKEEVDKLIQHLTQGSGGERTRRSGSRPARGSN